MTKVKLTPEETERQIVEQRFDLVYESQKLGDLIQKFGPDAHIELSQYYDDCTVYIVVKKEETDEQYERRIEAILKQKQIVADIKAKKKEKEYKEFLRLKKKFEGKEL